MINAAPIQINKLVRNVVLNHPNNVHCQFIRKVATRISDTEVMGLPTIGGLGVLSIEDEESIAFEPLGNAYALRAEQFGAALMNDQQDDNNGANDTFLFLIEPEILPPAQWGFTIKKNDVFYMIVSDVPEIKLGFEVVGIETVSNIPPFNQRYICNRRSFIDIV